MTLEELSATLPNGFHDARVGGLHLDFVGRTAVLDLSVWTGDDSDPEAHRAARLELKDLQFCVLETPDHKYPYAAPEPLWISEVNPPGAAQLPQNIPSGAFTSSFFVNQWNAFVHIAARDAVLFWL